MILDELGRLWELAEVTQVKLASQHQKTGSTWLLLASQGLVRAMDEVRAAARLVEEYEENE